MLWTDTEQVAVLDRQLLRHVRCACNITLRRNMKLTARCSIIWHFVGNAYIPSEGSRFLWQLSTEGRVNSAMKSSNFWDITSCSPFKVNRRFRGTCRLHLQGQWIIQTRNQRESRWQAEPYLPPASKLACSSTLKKEATCFSETSVEFQRTTWACSHLCEDLKSYNSTIPAVRCSNISTNQQTN
jgi:hypothetical protein